MSSLNRVELGSVRWLVLGAVLALAATILPQPVAAQDAEVAVSEPHHAVFVEAGGAGLVYSVNYEFRPVDVFALRVGGAAVPECFGVCGLVTAAASVILFQDGSDHLEMGLGGSFGLVDDDDAIFVVPQIGYRYEEDGGGLLVRVGFTPLFRANDLTDVIPMAGVSLGYSW